MNLVLRQQQKCHLKQVESIITTDTGGLSRPSVDCQRQSSRAVRTRVVKDFTSQAAQPFFSTSPAVVLLSKIFTLN
ncbi:hypothetical protein AGIG_G21135 [Arapaima gigas]